MEPPTLEELNEAAALVAHVARRTPVFPAPWLERLIEGPVWMKCENLQRSGSFKVRGAYVRMARLTEQERSRGVVAASAGNHAQGVAVAAARLGTSATVFMPRGAALPKVEATKGYGARVELVGEVVDDALAAAQEFAQRTGSALIHPFDHRDIVLGQGTVGLEILEQVPDVRTVVVPVGGGGLVAGIASALHAAGSTARVVGVQAAGAAAYPPSLGQGRPVRLAAMATVADGIAVALPGAIPFSLIAALQVTVETVEEESIARALVQLMERSKQVVEPAGGVAAAALLQPRGEPWEAPVVVVLSGGNIDPVVLLRVLHHGLAASGRYLAITVRLADRPGSLAGLLGKLADAGVNVLDVDHVWTDPTLVVGQIEVLIQAETRGYEHRAEVLQRLADAGYRVRTAPAP